MGEKLIGFDLIDNNNAISVAVSSFKVNVCVHVRELLHRQLGISIADCDVAKHWTWNIKKDMIWYEYRRC